MEEKTRIKRSGRGWLNPFGYQTRGSGDMAQVKDSRIYDRQARDVITKMLRAAA